MYVNLVAMAFVVFGMAISTTAVKGQVLINLTNQVWKYNQDGVDPGSFWDPTFDDSAWPEGRGVFAAETSTGVAALDANVYPYTNTVLLAPPAAPGNPNHTVDYFRTRFTFSGAGNPDHWVLTSSNLIDDGYVMYLNGVEVDRFNMNAANDTLAAAANPNGEGVYVVRTLCIPPGVLIVGENVLAVRVHQNAGTSSDVVWGTVLHSRLGSAPAVTSPTADVNMLVAQGRSTNLVVSIQAGLCNTLQWYKDNAPIDGATAATYTIADMDASKAGTYFLRIVNNAGTTDSPKFNVTFDTDVTPPTVVSATASLSDLRQITVVFSEEVVDPFAQPPMSADPITFYIQQRDVGGSEVGTDAVVYGASSNIFVLTLSEPGRDPGLNYELVIVTHTIQDRFGNLLADPTVVPVRIPFVLQEGLNGYVGTEDTEVRFSAPASAAGGQAATVNVDTQDGTPAGAVHAFVKFGNLIGNGPNQIPSGAVVSSATLRIWTDDQGSSPARVLRMLVNWDENSTWNSMVNGLDETNGVEAITFATMVVSDEGTPRVFDDVNVTSIVQDWVNGAPNYGFGFLPAGTDGWRWVTSENGSAAERPMLMVSFTVQIAPCNITDQPDSVTVNEKQPFALSVSSTGSDLSFQWYKNGSPIPGATASTYTVNRAVPADSGNYHVVINNNVPSTCTSASATVTVNPDVTAPALTSALGNRDQNTITLTFNDTLDAATAGNPSTYSLSGGIGISGVGINGSTVTLTQATPRAAFTAYTLTITGLRDDAVARNLIAPNPTVTNLSQQFVVLPFGSTWKFDTNGNDLGSSATAAPWRQPGYNDSAWPSGTDLLGLEPSAGILPGLAAQGLNTNNAMSWQLTRPDGTTNITYYLRNTVSLPFDTSGATLQIRHVTDDGALYYLNGNEVFRYNMPTGTVTYVTGASSAPGEGVIRTSGNISGIPCGPSVTVAVEVHNQNITSSDILFGGELLVTASSFGPCTGPSQLFIVNNGNGTVTLSWTGTGTLQQSTDLTNWTASPNQSNPQTFTPVGLKFYRVQ